MIKQLSNDRILAMDQSLQKMDWDRAIKLNKKKKRHENIDFTNPRHEELKAQVKQEIENRGLK